MTDYISLTCPTCSAKLKVTNHMNNFACGHCGSEHIIKREGGVISLVPLVESKKGANDGGDITESELAIPRLEKEIKQFEGVISEMREKLQTEDYIEISMGFSFYTVLIGALTNAIIRNWDLSTTLGVGIGSFLLAFVVLVDVTKRKEAKPKKEIDIRKQELEKHIKILSIKM